MAEKKPMIAVPIGDPAGVGPEIVARACALEKVNDAANVIVIGDRQVMEKAISIVGADLKINVVGIARSTKGIFDREGIDLSDYKERLENGISLDLERLKEEVIGMNIFN